MCLFDAATSRTGYMTVMDMAGFSVLKASSIFFLMVHPHTQACDLIHLDRQTHDLVARQTIPIPVEGVDTSVGQTYKTRSQAVVEG